MARPIADTPVLRGNDAVRFIEEMERVDNMPQAERLARRAKLQENVRWIKERINILL
jgi:hypothetical protein